jgi:hypothetical protein
MVEVSIALARGQNTTLTFCENPRWKDQRLDRYMVDYLLRTGKLSAAASYAKERNIEVRQAL